MEATSQGRKIAWSLAVLLLAANVAGYALNLYAAAWWFDRVLHAATLFALTFWLALLVFAPVFLPGRTLLAAALVTSLGVAIGAWWEVAEWAFDLLSPGNVIKGKNDTIIDIVMDTFGAALAAALAPHYLRSDQERPGS
ncbi:hypothetical protein GCM10011402_31260 [Paracoccus acridae]|uniref:VanZ-like domain-containing protein n=1 Tax=Paracoccus acridae TaxID=1795310 RepID=A0ABQ1VKQ6_9RHOB|nr:hypothetical protein [Paracoccus acridae]GGF76246.1 hypothetical protein GCM10011402_31260 [Paracoccus acridae]